MTGEPDQPVKGEARLRFHGRRKGRKLNIYRQKLVDTLLPQLRLGLEIFDEKREAQSGAASSPVADSEGLSSLFPGKCAEYWLEIGFGGGEHLAAQAATHPKNGMIGSEIYINGIASLLAHIDRQKLANIRLYDGDARRLIAALPEGVLSKIFVLFPDPWPKARHRERRFFQPENISQLARILKPGGELRVASDDAEYAEWALLAIRRQGEFCWQARQAAEWRTRPHDQPPTRYEEKARKAGRFPIYLSFTLVPKKACSAGRNSL